MKKKIKSFILKWLLDPTDDFSPKFSKKLEACSFTSKSPLGKGKYNNQLYQCTEWDNGEGYDFTWNTDNKENHISLCTGEIDGLLACLDYMNYFEE